MKPMVSTALLLLGVGVAFSETNNPPLNVESAIRQCLFAIIDDTAALKDRYPELSEYSPTALKQDVGHLNEFPWSMSFGYRHNYTPAAGYLESQAEKFGKNGCYLHVGFRESGKPEQFDYLSIPSLNVNVHVDCHLSKDGSANLEKEFRLIVNKHLTKLGKVIQGKPS